MYRPLPPSLTIKRSPINGLGLFALIAMPGKIVLGITHIQDDRFEQGWIRTPLGGFYNHSVDPNCRIIRIGDLRKIITTRHINVNEEITVRYTLYTPEGLSL